MTGERVSRTERQNKPVVSDMSEKGNKETLNKAVNVHYTSVPGTSGLYVEPGERSAGFLQTLYKCPL